MNNFSEKLWAVVLACIVVWELISLAWANIPVGTKSILVGAHQFILHPIYLACAWMELYGFPKDPRLWVVFFVHDLGYLGMPNMDGPEGEKHVEWAANFIHRWFDQEATEELILGGRRVVYRQAGWYWHDLCLYHSRHYAKAKGARPSALCYADKLVFKYQIKWLYLLGVRFSGELKEYMENAKYGKGQVTNSNPGDWYDSLNVYMQKWVAEHKDGQSDETTVIRHENKNTTN